MTSNKQLLIVEDEQIIAENLRLILNEYGYKFVDVAMDFDEMKQLFEQTRYDLVLMDINLGETSTLDGIDLIKWFEKKYSFSHIYVTANADAKTVNKAKDTNPSGYILKPFVNSSIYVNVQISLNKDQSFSFTNKGMQQQVILSEITHIQADGAYIHLHITNGEKHFIRKSLTEFHNEYSSLFVRIHKSTLVNKQCIESYNSHTVKVNDFRLPLGRTYKSSFLERIEGIPIG